VKDCIFCRIIAGDLPSVRIHDDDQAVVIMDINPATRGHALVIPRAHARDILDIAPEALAHCAQLAASIGGLAMRNLGAAGITIMQSNGAAAWQTVFHYHVHVIPRYDGDPLVLPWEPRQGDADEIRDTSRAYLPE
jgi:histidine triad (HIT) family protein